MPISPSVPYLPQPSKESNTHSRQLVDWGAFAALHTAGPSCVYSTSLPLQRPRQYRADIMTDKVAITFDADARHIMARGGGW